MNEVVVAMDIVGVLISFTMLFYLQQHRESDEDTHEQREEHHCLSGHHCSHLRILARVEVLGLTSVANKGLGGERAGDEEK
jgi:hypothetical protein